jgi:hypothetical protein
MVNHHPMNVYTGVEVKLHAFGTTLLHVGEQLDSHPHSIMLKGRTLLWIR